MKLTQSLLFSFLAVVSVNALSAHQVRHAHHAHAIAARAPQPVVDASIVTPVRRQNSRRCRPRNSSSSVVPTTTPATTQAPPLAAAPTTTAPPPPATTQPAPPPPNIPVPAPPPLPAGNLPSYMIGTQTGQGTFYDTGLGACGIHNTDTDYIAAVSHLLFDTFPGYQGGNPNLNPICGRRVSVRYQGSPAITVTITDRCEGCAITDLDFSPSAFAQLASFSAGRIHGIQWEWI